MISVLLLTFTMTSQGTAEGTFPRSLDRTLLARQQQARAHSWQLIPAAGRLEITDDVRRE